MSTKAEILKALEAYRTEFVSGQLLADRAHVSRNAVWKAIQELKKEGYDIRSITNKGYMLTGESDVLSREAILLHLGDSVIAPEQVHVYKMLESTNITAKKLALEGAAHGMTVTAESQSAGRGRLGRSFFSPAGSGIYMSMILKPSFTMEKSLLITAAAAVCTARAIKIVTGMDVQIKWVNDLYLNNKKICGILTEAVSNFETGEIESIVVGIGVNLTTKWEGDAAALKDVADSLFSRQAPLDELFSRNQLIAEIIRQMLLVCTDLENASLIHEYKERSCILGKSIFVIRQNERTPAIATDINSDGHLIVKYGDGRSETLSSGEISIRMQ